MKKPVADGKGAPELVSEHGAGQNTKLPGPPKHTPTAPHVDAVVAYVSWWRWGFLHRAEIGYSEGALRLKGEHFRPGSLPLVADCSGLTYDFADWAGLKLPYTGVGNTDSLMVQCAPLTAEQARPGDLAIFGRHGATTGTNHVVTLIEKAGSDWQCGSHGSKTNPCHKLLLSVEAAYQASVGYPQINFRRIPR
jgi:hypothetical protein